MHSLLDIGFDAPRGAGRDDAVSIGVRQRLLPTLLPLAPNLIAADFALMKLLPAQAMIDHAVRSGRLPARGGLIVESSSGTLALALALVARQARHRLVIVSDGLDPCLNAQLAALDVDVRRAPPRNGMNIQQSRLAALHDILREMPQAFWPAQYDNPANPASYDTLAAYLAQEIGTIDALIGPVGSGGSMSGTSTALRRRGCNLQAVAVDTPGSILFGAPDGERRLRGLGSGIPMANLDHQAFDEVHWVGVALAHQATHRLYQDFGLFKGPTSGAAFAVADWHAARAPQRRFVVMLPDDGYRYTHTVYSAQWQAETGYLRSAVPDMPALVQHPHAVRENNKAGETGIWHRYRWQRRRLHDVLAPEINR